MRPRSLAVLSITLALLAVSCTPNGGLTTEVDLREFKFGYMERYFLVPTDEVEQTLSILTERAIELEKADISEILTDIEGDEEGVNEYNQAREALGQVVQLFTVPEDQDSLDLALMIRQENAELRGAPPHAIGEAGHVSWAPGNDAVPLSGVTLPKIPDGSGDAYAAVVDTGIERDAPGLQGNVEAQPFDEEPGGGDGHSHGTFVSGIIRHLAPDHRITFARPQPANIADFTWVDDEGERHKIDGEPRQTLTGELQVAHAIERIIQRHQRSDSVHSLNLSLGSYSEIPFKGPSPSIFVALSRWFDAFPEAHVFAAAGNDPVVDPVLPFWPAALSQEMDRIHSVAALDDPADGEPQEIVWVSGTETAWDDLSTTPRDWVTHWAPGSLLVNHTGMSTVAAWSGSSFATAVANGLYLRDEDPVPVRRADVTGLVYWDGNKVLP